MGRIHIIRLKWGRTKKKIRQQQNHPFRLHEGEWAGKKRWATPGHGAALNADVDWVFFIGKYETGPGRKRTLELIVSEAVNGA